MIQSNEPPWPCVFAQLVRWSRSHKATGGLGFRVQILEDSWHPTFLQGSDHRNTGVKRPRKDIYTAFSIVAQSVWIKKEQEKHVERNSPEVLELFRFQLKATSVVLLD